MPDTNFYVLAVAAVTLAVALIIRRWRPRWPGMLVAMVVGALLSVALSGPDHGVSLVGKLPAHLPPPSVPDLSWTTLRDLAPKALAVALLGLIEAVSIGRAIATRSGQRIDGNHVITSYSIHYTKLYDGSTEAGAPVSQPPTYPTQAESQSNIRVQ